jgi:hypothetical protein
MDNFLLQWKEKKSEHKQSWTWGLMFFASAHPQGLPCQLHYTELSLKVHPTWTLEQVISQLFLMIKCLFGCYFDNHCTCTFGVFFNDWSHFWSVFWQLTALLATVQQIWDRYWYQIILSLFWAWYWYQYFFCWWENPLSCIWIYKWKKKNCLCFFSFFLQYGQLSCVSNEFLVGSVIWDNTEYFLTFQRQYLCIVSGKWDKGDTCIVLPLLHRCFWSVFLTPDHTFGAVLTIYHPLQPPIGNVKSKFPMDTLK